MLNNFNAKIENKALGRIKQKFNKPHSIMRDWSVHAYSTFQNDSTWDLYERRL